MQCASETILMLIVKNIFHIFICNEIIAIQLISRMIMIKYKDNI